MIFIKSFHFALAPPPLPFACPTTSSRLRCRWISVSTVSSTGRTDLRRNRCGVDGSSNSRISLWKVSNSSESSSSSSAIDEEVSISGFIADRRGAVSSGCSFPGFMSDSAGICFALSIANCSIFSHATSRSFCFFLSLHNWVVKMK